jgi:hypothetical protein
VHRHGGARRWCFCEGCRVPSEVLVAHVSLATTKHVSILFSLGTLLHALCLVIAHLVIEEAPLKLHNNPKSRQYFVYLERYSNVAIAGFVLRPQHKTMIPLSVFGWLALLYCIATGPFALDAFCAVVKFA